MKYLPLLLALCSLTAPAQTTTDPAATDSLDLHGAMQRLLSYGIINETPENEYDDSIDILHHYAKYLNRDEDINDFPYCLRLIEAGGEDNRLPVSCLRPFVEAGATIQGEHGDTSPLQAAAETGNSKVVHYLLSAGADVYYTDDALRTALDYALMGELTAEHCEIVLELLQHHALPTPTAMCYVARHHTGLLRAMLSHGGTATPEVLNAAVWNADSLDYLLQNGANVYNCAENGTTISRALLQRLSTGKWQEEEISRILDLLTAHQTPFYFAGPREEIELMLPEDMSPSLRDRLLTLYTTRPAPTFPETEESDVEEVEETL